MDNSTPFRTFGTMLDCSRNAVPNLHTLKKWVDLTASLGYNTLLLYTEDTYEVPDEPYFGYMRGRYSQAELRELDAYAKKQGMTIMPCIQTLAHLYAIKRWPEYWPHFDTDDILLAGDERVYTLIGHMFRSYCVLPTANAGMITLPPRSKARFKTAASSAMVSPGFSCSRFP